VNIPVTVNGKAIFMIQNILPVIATSFALGFKIEDLRVALQTFIPSPAQTPGRMNIFEFRNYTVMVDYAHNPAGFTAISKFLEKIEAKPKVGIVSGVGDRRNEDIEMLGELSAKMFDEIIIRQDRNLRGRTEQEIIDHISIGIKKINPDIKITVIPKESEAITFALKNAIPGSFITILSDVVPDALEIVQKYKEEDAHFTFSKSDIPNQIPVNKA
jgi:cyanophycin synthetase